jgi:hypothetical protein
MKVTFQMSHAETFAQAAKVVHAARMQRVRANGKLREQNLRRMVERWAARRHPLLSCWTHGLITDKVFEMATAL